MKNGEIDIRSKLKNYWFLFFLMLYLIGLGLNENGFSWEAYKAVEASDKAYIEFYTVDFPYNIKLLEKELGSIIPADRNFIESFKVLEEAKNKNVALLVYGSPLTATTHISLIQEAKKRSIKVKIIHNASVFDAIAETGLQLYKFGRTTSLPNFGANSYLDVVKDNLKIKAHTLILVDIGMDFRDAIGKLVMDSKDKGVKLEKVVVCSRLGNKDSSIYYNSIDKLKAKKIKAPFCIIVPSELHFMEEEFLEGFGK